MGFNLSNLKNYALWAAIAAFVLLILQDFHVAVDAATYNQLTTAFLGILVLAGIVNSPVQAARLLTAGQFTFNWAVLKSYTLWAAVFAFLLLALQAARVQIQATVYNQLVSLFLQILVLAGIINSPAPASAQLKPAAATVTASGYSTQNDEPAAPKAATASDKS